MRMPREASAIVLAMLTVWHSIKPYFLTIAGLFFLLLVARGMVRGETASRYGGKIYRAESPISFWFFFALNLILGIALVGAGIASFYKV
jgi:hypothetical protein